MVKWRAILSFVLVLVWTATPALACVPKSTMTKVEMECCKKMAGDCHMGSRNHPCCEKNANQPSSVANVQRSHVLNPVFAAIVTVVQISSLLMRDAESHRLTQGLPPPSPPSISSILRI
jgi:hypothetical protein